MQKPLTKLSEFVSAGLLSAERAEALADVAARYAIAITPDMASLIDKSDPEDPIAAQFVPSTKECVTLGDESADPIGDEAHSPVPGIVHRYPDRVLLKAASVCPVYCRFCFRREMVGPENGRALGEQDLQAAFAYIADNPAIWEVVITGGDPFALSPRRMRVIRERLETIEHVAVLRWHTRVPVVQPSLVTDDLIAAIKSSDRAVYVAIHANHPREFTKAARQAIARLANAGLCLIGQTVLLKGVNDDRVTLEKLMRTFVANRIRPYYLHHLDRAPGTSRFRVPLSEGQALVRSLRGHISGLCQPTYVIDIPGGAGKANATPCDVSDDRTDGYAQIGDRNGERHRYECDGSGPRTGPDVNSTGRS